MLRTTPARSIARCTGERYRTLCWRAQSGARDGAGDARMAEDAAALTAARQKIPCGSLYRNRRGSVYAYSSGADEGCVAGGSVAGGWVTDA